MGHFEEIRLRPDDRTPEARMRSALHHVRCEECDACQEYLVDSPSAPLCDHARALVRLDKGQRVGDRARDGLHRVGWMDFYGGGVSERGRSVLEYALEAVKKIRGSAEVARPAQ